MKNLKIQGQSFEPGQSGTVDLQIARLASGTEIDLPILVYRGKEKGPTVLFSGGLHGDEVNGIEIIRRMVEGKLFERVKRGSVIAIPIVNIYGFLQFSRAVPDGKDINRSFPGSHVGSLASRVAYHIRKFVLSEIDFGIDFHTGGSTRYNFPQVRYAKEDKKAHDIAMAFGAPLMLQSKFIDRSFRQNAYKQKKSIVVFEGGESMRFDEAIIQHGIDGSKRILKHFDMVDQINVSEAKTPIRCYGNSWIRAQRSGLFTAHVKSGTFVNKNQLIGMITDPFGTFKSKVKSRIAGFILGHNNMPVVNQGDALFHIAKTVRTD